MGGGGKLAAELLDEFLEGGDGVVGARLHLNGEHALQGGREMCEVHHDI